MTKLSPFELIRNHCEDEHQDIEDRLKCLSPARVSRFLKGYMLGAIIAFAVTIFFLTLN